MKYSLGPIEEGWECETNSTKRTNNFTTYVLKLISIFYLVQINRNKLEIKPDEKKNVKKAQD